ncbi:MAG: hypothetical protein MPN21_18490 [Thermoanaerobaculia bacterium]|nr:hypothetical protein [Thermoanaerobaculia bacterium]
MPHFPNGVWHLSAAGFLVSERCVAPFPFLNGVWHRSRSTHPIWDRDDRDDRRTLNGVLAP